MTATDRMEMVVPGDAKKVLNVEMVSVRMASAASVWKIVRNIRTDVRSCATRFTRHLSMQCVARNMQIALFGMTHLRNGVVVRTTNGSTT